MNRVTLKRINAEIRMFLKNQHKNIKIYHNSDNILQIYFKFKGVVESDYHDGEYICRIDHNPEYPVKAPDLVFLTPNGRFQINKKICLTNTSYHQETWAPAGWNLESFIQAFISVFYSDSKTDRIGIGHIKVKDKEKTIRFANQSNDYNKDIISNNKLIFI
tara:strand:+ start:2724 stop:3206 length:483 start_codon:yes stop_codon:yes gene_type:complete